MTKDYSKFTLGGTSAASTPVAPSTLLQYGWQPYFAQQLSADALMQTPPVRIVEVHRSGLHVIGNKIDLMIPPRSDVTVGDWLLLNQDLPAHSKVLERKSLMKRRAPGTDVRFQLIAANIDTGFIVTSCNQDFNIARLERFVALAFEAEIAPVIVITKSDLVDDPSTYVAQAARISDAVPALALDARGDAPKERLAPWCKAGQTVAFLGSSGVGKSTLSNALSGTSSIETQAIREHDAKGRHTTTRRQLHLVEGGCLVLDTPGMRELQLADAALGIENVFADLSALAADCRFNDCRHESEPGCAVLAALAAGEIDEPRLNRWRKLIAEEAFNSATLSERRSADKQFGKRVKRTMLEKKAGRWRED